MTFVAVHLVLCIVAMGTLLITAASPLRGRQWAYSEHVLFWVGVVNLPLALLAAVFPP